MPISILLKLKILKRQYYMVLQIRTYENFFEYFIIQSIMSITKKKDKNLETLYIRMAELK